MPPTAVPELGKTVFLIPSWVALSTQYMLACCSLDELPRALGHVHVLLPDTH